MEVKTLGVGGAWGALSLGSFLLALPLYLDAFTIGVGSYCGSNGTEATEGAVGTG